MMNEWLATQDKSQRILIDGNHSKLRQIKKHLFLNAHTYKMSVCVSFRISRFISSFSSVIFSNSVSRTHTRSVHYIWNTIYMRGSKCQLIIIDVIFKVNLQTQTYSAQWNSVRVRVSHFYISLFRSLSSLFHTLLYTLLNVEKMTAQKSLCCAVIYMILLVVVFFSHLT